MVRRRDVLLLRAIQLWDRSRLRRLARRHPGLEIHPGASTNFAAARYEIGPGARLRIGAGAETERLPGALHFSLGPDAEVDVGDGTWLRTEIEPIHLVAFAGARITLGRDCFLNGANLSAKREITLARQASVGLASRVFDADQHNLDDEHPEQIAPVRIGECAWVAADVTILKGVTIGNHSVIGTRSLVTSDVPDHTLAFGTPARTRGKVGLRWQSR